MPARAAPSRSRAPRAPPSPAKPAFTPADERKLKQGMERFGRQWSTIHKNLFSRSKTVALSVIKEKGVDMIKASAEGKARLKSAKAAVKKVEACSFSRLVRLHGHDRVRQYAAFLVLKAVAEDSDATLLSPPSAAVDQVWHAHILDTKHYRETCDALCREFIDHDPDGGDDADARDVRRQYTADLAEELEPVLAAIKVSPAPPPPANPDGFIPAAGNAINLKVVTQDGNETYFKCKVTTALNALMNAFCQHRGIQMREVRFLFNGNRINGSSTPEELEMEDGDVVDVIVEQCGC